ncbi:zinc-binding protein A33-like [Pseudonaja textilis]|uniref:zinc-binding protein A33-like n=1 Tax=Pseudonaja textilis TaxID=8673 RepID=UPI000EA8EE80|nr:zinc-binding protein A33-like [Pseudonaja textilis]
MSSVQEVSSFTEDLLCPICLSLFREPHILECGHSFCAPCLEPCIPKGESQGLCPECRHPFTLHHVNRALSSLAKKARLLKLDEGTQLSSTGGWYFCEEHGEPLKLFCRQDKESVCVICRDLPQHRGHNFLPIKNAVQAYQDQLKASLELLEKGLRRLKRSQCHQQENIIELKTCSESLSNHISEEFAKMHQLLNDRERSIKQALEDQREKNLARMETKLKELDCKMASRSETLYRIQASLECKDHISFLKEAKELLERLNKEQGARGGTELDAELAGEDGESASSEDAGEYEKEVEEEKEEEDGVVAVDLNLGEFKGPLQFYAWKELLNAIHPVPASITLESYSAYPSLVFVEENTGIKFSRQRRSVGSFTSTPIPNLYTPYAVGQKGNSTGRFYWEIQVGDSPDWIVGMAQKFEKRKNWLNFLPKEGVWAIRLKAGNYQALSDPRTPLTVCGKMEKVGVYLDFEGGQLSFYNSSSMSHLYTFQACFHAAPSKPASILPILSTRSNYPILVCGLQL